MRSPYWSQITSPVPRPVFRERRKVPRRVINRMAQYQASLGALPRACMITDISEGGARLYAETEMPETFILAVTGDGVETRRECRVVWRIGGECGVKFIDRR